jgi:hypothetical protein
MPWAISSRTLFFSSLAAFICLFNLSRALQCVVWCAVYRCGMHEGVECMRACKMYEGGAWCGEYEDVDYTRSWKMYEESRRKYRVAVERAI